MSYRENVHTQKSTFFNIISTKITSTDKRMAQTNTLSNPQPNTM